MRGVGPQHAGDDSLAARMRLHQSWYRDQVLGVPCGTGPSAESRALYGNMLRAEDGERGLNFLTPAIAAFARARQAELPGGVEQHRLFCNMLSSQPMSFNLLGPIALDPALGARLVGALIDAPIARVRRVVFEHAPSPAERYLGDRTSFDAYVEVDLESGQRGFVGIETKLTEPFSTKHYPLAHRPLYRRWVERSDAPWRAPEDRPHDLDAVGHNQLWRDHMLAFALLSEHRSELSFGTLVLVRHHADAMCASAVRRYAACLHNDERSFLDRPLDEIMRLWSPIVCGTRHADWLDSFRRRYVDLTESETCWREQRP